MSKTETTARTADEQRAYDAGLDRGWDHANFVASYGKEHDRRTPDYPAWLHLETTERGWIVQGVGTGMPVQEASWRIALRPHFAEGWKEGRKRFGRNRYADDSKIDG
ncbi:hypothetical protein [Streptomyces sp. NPDC088752]|uniref:hypothetical protein n=1 Tax=Streptomyces sp. NPDC088752 TaxID=3154963 RepID=UPI00341EB823